MIYDINIKSNTSNYLFKTSLDGVDYQFLIRWNERDSHYYIHLLDADGNRLASGRKAVINTPLFMREISDEFPPGLLFLIDMEESSTDPGLLDLGVRVRLTYLDEESTV